MKTTSLFSLAILSASLAFGAEGGIGTQAYQWVNYSDLNPTTPHTYSLASYLGKVVLLGVFQYDCGGCDANAPMIGKIADSLGSGSASVPFQAMGAEIDNATYAEIQASYHTQLIKTAPNVNYPLVHVPFDTGITTINGSTYWKRYNCYRDVYFVIDYTGKITDTVSGNFTSAMSAASFTKLKAAIVTAIAAVPASITPLNSSREQGFRAYQQGGVFHFGLGSASKGPVSLQILDLQGRMIRAFSVPSGAEAIWNGMSPSGSVPFGTYFVKATGAGFSVSQRINWLP